MTADEFEELIEKYRRLSSKLEIDDDLKSYEYDRFASWLEENKGTFEDEDEDELLFSFREQEDEGNNWDSMFPEGDEDDSITDWMTQD